MLVVNIEAALSDRNIEILKDNPYILTYLLAAILGRASAACELVINRWAKTFSLLREVAKVGSKASG